MWSLGTDFKVADDYKPYYHLNGFSHGDLQIITTDALERSQTASWGLVPDWAADDMGNFRKKTNTLNARSESIFEKSTFRESALNQRCLILADGFFEPHHENNQAIPYFCYQPSSDEPAGDLFLFAGLYNRLDSETITASILTTTANPFFAEIHNKKKRMPLVLDQNYYLDWLDDGLSQQSLNELMATGFTTKAFKAHPVSRDLYKRNVDTNKPFIVEEVETGRLF